MSTIIHRDVLQLSVSPEQVREFIMTAERIADYFPGVMDCGTFDVGKSIWCSAKSGVCLLQLVEEESSDFKVTMNVITARKVAQPYTAEAIKANAFMSMVEDWEIEAHEGGTRVTKIWRDVVMHKIKWLPMATLVRWTAKGEHQKLVDGWNGAAS
jgi:carbon monoxide dehydrogenase subunit G